MEITMMKALAEAGAVATLSLAANSVSEQMARFALCHRCRPRRFAVRVGGFRALHVPCRQALAPSRSQRGGSCTIEEEGRE